jgi:hypothetical protein
VEAEDLTTEGAIQFWAVPDRTDAFTDPLPYHFPSLSSGNIAVTVVKNPDLTLLVDIAGPHWRSYSFNSAIPQCDARGLHVTITWDTKTVRLYLNGREAQSIEVKVH